MDTTRLPRTCALLASAALLASLSVATVAAPTSAARPRCDGRVATIVSYKKVIRGTSRADVIVAKGNKANTIYGKGGRDHICGGRGNDHIYGGSGNDRLFGGSGHDVIYGQLGKDDIFGFSGTDVVNGGDGGDFISGGSGDDRLEGAAGNDIVKGGDGPDSIGGSGGNDKLYGEAGNDEINGGAGTDICKQGAGSGPITACEGATADLAITVSSPANAPAGSVNFTVTVKNNGPEATAYTLTLANDNSGATCSGKDSGDYNRASLGSGQQRQEVVAQDCETDGAGATVSMDVSVTHDGTDPNIANNADNATTTFTS